MQSCLGFNVFSSALLACLIMASRQPTQRLTLARTVADPCAHVYVFWCAFVRLCVCMRVHACACAQTYVRSSFHVRLFCNLYSPRACSVAAVILKVLPTVFAVICVLGHACICVNSRIVSCGR